MNSCTSPTPSVSIFPISSEMSAARSSLRARDRIVTKKRGADTSKRGLRVVRQGDGWAARAACSLLLFYIAYRLSRNAAPISRTISPRRGAGVIAHERRAASIPAIHDSYSASDAVRTRAIT